jgi:3-phenylpropionate/trans-cinnamate dioxygenase ferredoxin reductase component
MTPDVDVLLIGGGVASAGAAHMLREQGFRGSVLLVAREGEPPYRRPPVSKSYLAGDSTRAEALVYPEAWWAQQKIDLVTRTSVVGLCPQMSRARLSSREEISFGSALIATGAMVRRLDVEGSDLKGIHYLRTLGNADTVRDAAEGCDRILCVGGSYLASEVAASFSSLGCDVTMVMQEAHPMIRQFGELPASVVRAALEEHGVTVISDEQIQRFSGDEGGHVRIAHTSTGREVRADLVVCGVGVRPDVALARKSGLQLGLMGGVVCNSMLRSSAPNIWAAGDICEFDSVLHRAAVRLEHEHAAETQGATAARNILGSELRYAEVPYFFSDLSDWMRIEYLSISRAHNKQVLVGSVPDRSFSLRYLLDGQLTALLSVGDHGDLGHARDELMATAGL